jgi:hypothetical protein
MSKHTPGPWYAEKVCAVSGWVDITAMQDGRPTLPFAACKHFDQKANARLIAAAPDLLEAAQLCRQYMYEYASNTQDNAFDKLCAAIAKATGEQS